MNKPPFDSVYADWEPAKQPQGDVAFALKRLISSVRCLPINETVRQDILEAEEALSALEQAEGKREVDVGRLAAKKLIWKVGARNGDPLGDAEQADIEVLTAPGGKAYYGVRYNRFDHDWEVGFWCGNIGMWFKRLPTIEAAKETAQQHYDSIVRENATLPQQPLNPSSQEGYYLPKGHPDHPYTAQQPDHGKAPE